jgi:hypothetical protein
MHKTAPKQKNVLAHVFKPQGNGGNWPHKVNIRRTRETE